MKRLDVSELKASLTEAIAAVRAGEEILTTDGERAVARLVAAEDFDVETEGLIRSGILRRPARRLDVDRVLTADLEPDPKGRLLRALLDEREER